MVCVQPCAESGVRGSSAMLLGAEARDNVRLGEPGSQESPVWERG